jgi:hypothetical protein
LALVNPIDSDSQLVPTDTVNAHLLRSNVALPPSAQDVHFMGMSGLSPTFWLRFSAEPEVLHQFCDGVLRAWHMDNADFGFKKRAWERWEQSTKPWWSPRNDLPWYFRRTEYGPSTSESCFLQVDEQTNTVYLWQTCSC